MFVDLLIKHTPALWQFKKAKSMFLCPPCALVSLLVADSGSLSLIMG